MTRPNEPAEADLRDPLLARLGEGADLTPVHRQRLLERLAPAAPARRSRPWALRLAWGAAAAAAVLVAVVGLWPARVEPIPPTDLLGALFGPLPEMVGSPSSEPAAAEAEAASPVTSALAVIWDDLEGPWSIAARAIEAPRALLDETVSPPAPAGEANPTRKEN